MQISAQQPHVLQSGSQPIKPPQGKGKPLIYQNSRQIAKKKLPSVIRCLSTGQVETESGTSHFILAGCQDKNLYILGPKLELLQTIHFEQWVRCIASGDLNNDGVDDLAVGIGDRTLRIYNRFDNEYVEGISVNFGNFVNTCAIADIDNDGFKEVLAGSWDKTMMVFDGQSFSLKWQKQFDREVDLIKVADINWDGKPEVIVLVKGGSVYVLEGTTGNEIWKYKDEVDLMGLDIGPIDSTGFPYLVVGGKRQTLLFFDHKFELKHEMKITDQILSIKIADIDGGDHNEVTVGLQQNKISVFELKEKTLTSLELKYTLKTAGAITDILVSDLNKDNKNEIIYGGYDCSVTVTQDFHYGEKEAIGIQTPNCGNELATPLAPSGIQHSTPDIFPDGNEPNEDTELSIDVGTESSNSCTIEPSSGESDSIRNQESDSESIPESTKSSSKPNETGSHE
jgi:hypothetical protein